MMRKTVYLVSAFFWIIGCQDSGPSRGGVPEQQANYPAAESGENGITHAPLLTNQGKINHSPRISAIDVTPLYPKTGDTIKIETTAADPDGDTVKLIYEWTHNDVALTEDTDTLKLESGFKRGDRIVLTIIPYDGLDRGNPGRMEVTIGNSSPEIISSACNVRLDTRIFMYQVNAVDKDDDSLTYILKTGPAGMIIDPVKGLIRWNIPLEFAGKVSVTVAADDGQGGESVQSFALEISAGEA